MACTAVGVACPDDDSIGKFCDDSGGRFCCVGPMTRLRPSTLTGGCAVGGFPRGGSVPSPLRAWCWGGGGIVTIPEEEAGLKSGC